MKIVCICRVYPTQRAGGMPFVCQDRARALVREGHEVIVLTTNGVGDGSPVDDQGVQVLHLHCAAQQYSTQFAHECRQTVKRIKPDLVHFDSCDFNHVWWTDMRKQFRTAITMHGFYMGEWLTQLNLARSNHGTLQGPDMSRIREQVRVLDAEVDRVLAISQHEYRMLASVYNIRESVLRLVYNPIAEQFFSRPTIDASGDTFACVAVSGYSTRGFDIASSAANHAGVKLKKITNLPRENVPEFLDGCLGLLIPTYYAQGFDLTFAEALLRRRPVICTTAGSYFDESQPFTASRAVIRVSQGSMGQLADAMESVVLSDPMKDVPAEMQRHQPSVHVANWLAAVM